MTTRVYATQEDVRAAMIRLLSEDLSGLLMLALKRYGSRFAIDYLADSLPLPFPPLPGPGPEPQGPATTGPRPVITPGGPGPETGPVPPNPAGFPVVSNHAFTIVVMVQANDFIDNFISAVIDGNPGPYLRRQVTLETKLLSDDDWFKLMKAARNKDPVGLRVKHIVQGAWEVNRERAVATDVIEYTAPVQSSMLDQDP